MTGSKQAIKAFLHDFVHQMHLVSGIPTFLYNCYRITGFISMLLNYRQPMYCEIYEINSP